MSLRANGLHALVVLSGILTLAGCGLPGSPQPPSLQLPKPVNDLAATRKGSTVTLTWTPPTQTTDGLNIRRAGSTEVCRAVGSLPMPRCEKIAVLADAQVEHWTKGTMAARHDYTDTLPDALQQQNPTTEATYALNDLNRSARSAGLSNQVTVPLAPTLPPPNGLEAKVIADGVLLSWTGSTPPVTSPPLHYLYRIFRRDLTNQKQSELIAGEVAVPAESFLDRNIDWEQRYAYHIAAVTAVEQSGKEPVEVEGDDSPTIEAVTHDIFPPAVPTGLQAVYSGVGQKPFIDLTWAPNLESDLAGYNVYRREAGTQPTKINTDVVKTPSFRDPNAEPGHQYFYSVSAIDVRGNESAKSEETSERVPE